MPEHQKAGYVRVGGKAGLLLLLAVTSAAAQVTPARLIGIASGLASVTELTNAGDGSGRLFVVEQIGRIRILRNGAVNSAPFLDWTAKVSCCGERGLLGLAFSPRYPVTRQFYMYYTAPGGSLTISRMHTSADADRADSGSEEVLLSIPHSQTNHNGGRLGFGPDGYLYIGLGDGGGSGDPDRNGQNANVLLGKILRIDPESVSSGYAIPRDNPFAGQTGQRTEIWAYGLRNPWKFSFDRATGDLWIADVGQNRAEEVNFQPAASRGGQNYGWNRMEGMSCYPVTTACDRTGLTLPVLEYTRDRGVSITGGYVYRGKAAPLLTGAYVYGDFSSGRVWGLTLNATGGATNQNVFETTGLQISTFGQDEAGELYVAGYRNGRIYRFAGPPVPISVVSSASFAEGLAPGSLATIFGNGIAPVFGIVPATSFPLPRDTAGVSVRVNGIAAPVLAVASVDGVDQINFQVPLEIQPGASVTIQVSGGAETAPAQVAIRETQPEIFTVTQQTGGWVIWATGLGAVSNAPATGEPAPSSPLARTLAETRVTVGGSPATVLYSGLAPGFAGLYQINVVPAAGVPVDAPVVVQAGGASSRPWRKGQ
jgi:glucose/arabinose dehydrogenase